MELAKTGEARVNRNVRDHQELVGAKKKRYHYEKLIEESEEIVEEMNQQMLQIEKELIKKKFLHEKAISGLKHNLRYGWIHNEKWIPIDDEQNFRSDNPKKMELDKLTFANNAYREKKALVSFSSGKREINIHNLNNRMLHETHSMDGERRLLKMLCKDIDFEVSLKQIEEQIWRLHSAIKWPQYNSTTRDKEKDRRDLRELEYERDQVFVNAPSKASLWNSLPSTKSLRNEIQAMETRAEEKRKNVLKRRKKIESKERKIEKAEKEIKYMRKMIESIRIRKQRAPETISHSRENHDSL